MVELGKHGRNRTNVWDYPSVNSMAGSRREDLALHPTVKPVAMVVDAYQDVTKRGLLTKEFCRLFAEGFVRDPVTKWQKGEERA